MFWLVEVLAYILLQQAPDDSLLQTRLFNSLKWAEDEPPGECEESFFPSLQERLSFAAFQPVSGDSHIFFSLVLSRMEKVFCLKLLNYGSGSFL